MGKYNFELRKVCDIIGREEVENTFKDYKLEDYLTPAQIKVITENSTWSKDKLAKKIVDYYYMYEIGLDTIGLFIHQSKITMQLLMEYYLPLIYSRALDFDPLVNVDFIEEIDRTGNNITNTSSNSNSTSAGDGLSINSDTPGGRVTKDDILNGIYASSTSYSDTNASNNDITTSKGEANVIQKETRHQKGNSRCFNNFSSSSKAI